MPPRRESYLRRALTRPHYPLDEVKQLVAEGSFLVMRGRALNLLVPPMTYVAARGFIAAAIQLLTEDNFYKTVSLTWEQADEYGLNVDGVGWYIELCIDRTIPEVAVISFHPPERPMRTRAGLVKPP